MRIGCGDRKASRMQAGVIRAHLNTTRRVYSELSTQQRKRNTHTAGYTHIAFGECFSRNTPRNTKHSLYIFRISCKFRVLLMPRKNKP